MERNWQSDAIILKTNRIGEIHRGLSLIMPSGGLVSAIAHGAHSKRGSLRGRTELFAVGRCYMYTDSIKKSHKVKDFDVYNYHTGIRESLVRLYVASLWSEFLRATYAGGNESAAVFQLLHDALEAVDDADDGEASRLNLWFLWRLLDLYGNRPSLDLDVVTGEYLDPNRPLVFDLHEWGFTESQKPGSPRSVRPGALMCLSQFLKIAPAEARRTDPGPQGMAEIKAMLFLMIRELAEKPLKTLEQGVL